jgi:hypothetical protein
VEDEDEEDDDDDDVEEDAVVEVGEEPLWAVSVGMEVAEEVLLDEVLIAEGGTFFEPGAQEYQFFNPPFSSRLIKVLQSMSYVLVALTAPSTS